MPVYKCKMCGKELESEAGQNLAVCGFCRTSQTLPVSVGDNIIEMLNKGNHLRQICEFDKAASIYNKLLKDNHTDPEIYWQLALCRFGVKYIRDPHADIMVPECRRTRYKSILCDNSFIEASDRSDMLRRSTYLREAEYIDVMQKRLLACAVQQDTYNIFLCAAEKNRRGEKTPDFFLACEIYTALTKKGYNVFFPPVTLAGRAPYDYEPCVFSALNNAEIMITAAVRQENINSLKARDQWTRFLELINNNSAGKLIPVVRNIRLRSLPKPLADLPGYYLSSDNTINELIENIESILGEPVKNEDVTEEDITPEDLIRRGNLCLERKQWAIAEKYFERAVAKDPRNPAIYIGKLLIECELESADKLPEMGCDLSFSENCKKALELESEKMETLCRQSALVRGSRLMESAQTIKDLNAARELFSLARGTADAEELLTECSRRIETMKEDNYIKACLMLQESLSYEDTEKAREIFIFLENYKDSPLKVQECTELMLRDDYAKENAYRDAVNILKSAEFHSDYDRAAWIFSALDDYKSSRKMLKKCRRKQMLLSLSILVKIGFIAGLCFIVPKIIDKI